MVLKVPDTVWWPALLPERLQLQASSRWLRLGSWAIGALVGALSAGGLAAAIRKLSRPDARNVDVTAPAWMRGGIEWMDVTFPVPRLVIIMITVLALVVNGDPAERAVAGDAVQVVQSIFLDIF